MTGAGEALGAAARAALGALAALNGAYDGPPFRAAVPYAVVEAGPETDWSHKSGEGRELRLTVTINDQGERPDRARALLVAAEAAVAAIGPDLVGWRLVTLAFLRSRLLRSNDAAWIATVEFRARMLRV